MGSVFGMESVNVAGCSSVGMNVALAFLFFERAHFLAAIMEIRRPFTVLEES